MERVCERKKKLKFLVRTRGRGLRPGEIKVGGGEVKFDSRIEPTLAARGSGGGAGGGTGGIYCHLGKMKPESNSGCDTEVAV
ncbi:hypothetical protein EVAR_15065_1 [Eumeta japonica]|uniref:Uncharacterized protein n=1 Tax=Eumeta variegata TaxID=151549 RepID=A0A4C1YI20_EUMVA|nr:hypothetical protein EVAR_15065_1 [Eumeta japonica]